MQKIDLNQIKTNTREAQAKLAADFIETELPETLRQYARDGENFCHVAVVSSLSTYGNLSFNGKPAALKGQYRIIWDYLTEQGLNPVFYVTTGTGAYLGDDFISGGSRYHIYATWFGNGSPSDGFLAQELRALRDSAIAREAATIIQSIADKIETASTKGADWLSVYSFSAVSTPNEFTEGALFPFDGKKENLTGVARLVWSYLESEGLKPRLYSTVPQTLWVRGIGNVTIKEGALRTHIAACWYDSAEPKPSNPGTGKTGRAKVKPANGFLGRQPIK